MAEWVRAINSIAANESGAALKGAVSSHRGGLNRPTLPESKTQGV